MNGLLLSMPGTPVLYYGDEIGMGDNIFLGDRDGVRTPMQWTSDRNGGFSRADPQRLYLPPIQDPIYGFEAVNVEAQSREPSSLLAWTRRLLAVRSSTHAFGRGRFTMLHPGNRKVLAYVREYDDDVILCVSNVSRTAQPVELELGAWKGRVPVEMMGRNAFPPIGELPYLLTLPGYGFFWFRLATDAEPPSWHTERLPVEDLPVLVLFDDWNSFFRSRVVPWRMALAEKTRSQLEAELLPRFMQRQRWYAAKTDAIGRARLVDHGVLGKGARRVAARAGRRRGGRRQLRAISCRWRSPTTTTTRSAPARWRRWRWPRCASRPRWACSPTRWPTRSFCRALVEAIGSRHDHEDRERHVRFEPRRQLSSRWSATRWKAPLPLHRLTNSSNSVSLLGDRLFLKAYRRLQPRHRARARDGPLPDRCRRTTSTACRCRQRRLSRCRRHRAGRWRCCRRRSPTRATPGSSRSTSWSACSK